MTNQVTTEYRNVPLTALEESKTNPRRVFDDAALKELAESIRSQGVLSPLLVRPIADHRFEIVAGARRYRAALMAEADSIPVRIVPLTDAQALEAQLIENLQRRDVHPLEEAQGFRALLNLDEPKYSIEQIAAKMRSVSATRCFWPSCNPPSRNRPSRLASAAIGTATRARPAASCSPFAT
jgi:ParB family chromosome partitioning protein